MEFKKIIIVAAVLSLTACSKPHDFSGAYITTFGDSCDEVQPSESLIVIVPATGDNTYTASLNPQMSGGLFPTESQPAMVSDDGSLTFMFYKEGKSGFSSKPAVDMKIKLVNKNDDYIYIENWPVTLTSAKYPSMRGSFNFITDSEVNIMGQTAPNVIATYVGENGLCLKKSSV
ncbi:hypothetical protein UA32_12305 [Photobacterium angustum]|uniref:Lipoprotein n=1 Tax=Photobacterium angustum TaxID=661 RepID=A0ABX5GZ61_PHOAN|nr:hypothetical protein [Photobacterium angustum]KJG37733.1 hypothetical protein UA32_12305 [Photobacterium angustum]PSX03932.1 hypothetical protein C0W27_20775 [Photobacterium angustum]